MADMESLRFTAMEIAWRLYGLPYRWGGDDPIIGFDCSGFVVEILQSVGILPPGDWTAGMLYMEFARQQVDEPVAGSLVFWENSQGHIRHVEMAIGDGLSIGASGGGAATKSAQDASVQNAWIKIRPITGRGLIKGYYDPFKGV